MRNEMENVIQKQLNYIEKDIRTAYGSRRMQIFIYMFGTFFGWIIYLMHVRTFYLEASYLTYVWKSLGTC